MKTAERQAIYLRHRIAFDRCQQHARRCANCYHPIIDPEGNPGYFGEACAPGSKLLREYVDAENAIDKLLQEEKQ